jgi:PAT family beta-lactamase induction signal transducer AmpG
MLVAFLMGFSSGLPLLLTASLLQAWMKQLNVDLSIIGLMSLVGVPYTVKFLWAPLLDRYVPPLLGRRRGWLLGSQLALMAAVLSLGLTDPAKGPWIVASAAFMVSLFSATQDIVIDAYRREDLEEKELGLGSSFYINGYRLGMLLASGGGLILADHMPFSCVYFIMAACLLPGVATTLLTPEPITGAEPPRSLKEAVFEPLIDYFRRRQALLLLIFIILYKIGDSMASTMTTPFYLDIGFTKSEIGAVVKLFGFWATVGGGFLGGAMILNLGIKRGLWIFGILQALSTGAFSVLALIGRSVPGLASVIAFENLTSGMGTAAFAAFMASLTNKRFTATQYALLSSLMGVPRVMASAPTGLVAQHTGWPVFFMLCMLAALPGLLILRTLDYKNDAHA